MSQIPKKAREEARGILQQNPLEITAKLDSLHQKIVKQPRFTSLIQKWVGLKDYLLSSQTPLSKKVIILGGMIWMIFPDPILGPVDDIIVGTFLFPFISNELDKFQRGDYAAPVESKVHAAEKIKTVNRFFFPELC